MTLDPAVVVVENQGISVLAEKADYASDEALLRDIADRLSSVVIPGSAAYVFGSYARGQAVEKWIKSLLLRRVGT